MEFIVHSASNIACARVILYYPTSSSLHYAGANGFRISKTPLPPGAIIATILSTISNTTSQFFGFKSHALFGSQRLKASPLFYSHDLSNETTSFYFTCTCCKSTDTKPVKKIDNIFCYITLLHFLSFVFLRDFHGAAGFFSGPFGF